MRRREFIQTASAVASVVAGGLAIHPTPLRRTPYVDEIDPNYRALRERIIELAKAGHKVEPWELLAPRDGFRFVTIHIKGWPPIQFYQPSVGECI
jgi:hypothetical protein